MLRQFCRVYFEPAPDDTTLIRWANLIQPGTLHGVLEQVVQVARDLKVMRGRQLRIDGRVVETHIHYPTDSGLLGDGVRVLGRILERAQPWLGEAADLMAGQVKTWVQQARYAVKQISDLARRRGEEAQGTLRMVYQALVEVTEAVVARTQQVLTELQAQTDAAALLDRLVLNGTFIEFLTFPAYDKLP